MSSVYKYKYVWFIEESQVSSVFPKTSVRVIENAQVLSVFTKTSMFGSLKSLTDLKLGRKNMNAAVY